MRIQFDKSPRPATVFLSAIAIWLAVVALTGIRYTMSFDNRAVWVLCGAILSTLFGIWLGGRRPGTPLEPSRYTERGIRAACLIAAYGSLASVIGRLVLHQPVLPTGGATGIAQLREDLNLSSGGLHAANLTTPLATFGMGSGLLLVVFRNDLKPPMKAALLLALSQYLLYGLALGSRTHLAYVAVSLSIAYLATGGRIGWRYIAAAMTAAVGVFFASIVLLTGRLVTQDKSPTAAMTYLRREHFVDPPAWALALVGSSSRSAAEVGYALLSITHYVAHGVFEFLHLIQWRDETGAPAGLGSITLGPIGAVVPSALGFTVPSQQTALDHTGVYLTLWGSLLADFGVIGVILGAFLLGKASARLRQRSLETGSATAIMLYSLVATILFLSPFFNALGGAFGLYCLLSTAVIVRALRRA